MASTDLQTEYILRINQIFEFIDENLGSDLSLKRVAEAAFFSPFHFHRIFKSITGETLNEYVTRRRIERSALDLLHKKMNVAEVAHNYGYGDNSSFSKAFKKHFSISPQGFRKQNPHRHSKIRQLESKNEPAYPGTEEYICIIRNLYNWITLNAKIEIKEMPEMNVAYASSLGLQNLEKAYRKVVLWATPQGLMNNQTKMITIYHDSFKVTEASKVRMSVAILLDNLMKDRGRNSVGYHPRRKVRRWEVRNCTDRV